MPFSFLFRIDHIVPDFTRQSIQHYDDGGWKPPTWAAGLRTVERGRLYRWRSGVASVVSQSDGAYAAITQDPQGYEYSAGTVFTQAPWSQKFLAVKFDARWTNVDPNYRWEKLMFNHVPHPAGQNFYYSDLGVLRIFHKLSTSTNADWQRDLFPTVMHCDDTSTFAQNRRNAGLIGSLPFLIAVIAFSGLRQNLDTILQHCLQPSQHPASSQGRWQHLEGQTHGSTFHSSIDDDDSNPLTRNTIPRRRCDRLQRPNRQSVLSWWPVLRKPRERRYGCLLGLDDKVKVINANEKDQRYLISPSSQYDARILRYSPFATRR